MKLSVLLPTRGRPELLAQSIGALSQRATDPDNVHIVVGVDADDSSMFNWPFDQRDFRCNTWLYTNERQDTVGKKYNDLSKAADEPSDLYMAWADDVEMLTDGWDDLLRDAARKFHFKETSNYRHAGVVYSSHSDGPFPALYCMNHLFLEAQGAFAPEWFPNWWCENWTDEIATLSRRIVWLDTIETKEIGGRGKPQGLRDLQFWAQFFEATRPLRLAVVDRLNAELPVWQQHQLALEREGFIRYFTDRNSPLLNAENAKHFEETLLAAQPADERYLRAKAKAEAWLKEQK